MRKNYILAIVSLLALCGCNESSKKTEPIPVEPQTVVTVTDLRPSSMQSDEGCLLDGDCVTGAFCFHGTCVVQCESDVECEEGYVCTVRNGRCVTEAFAKTMAPGTGPKNADGISSRKMALTDLSAQDLAEARASSVKQTIADIEIRTPIPSTVYVEPGQQTVSVKLQVTQDYGRLRYVVQDRNTGVKTKLKGVNAKTNKSGIVSYTFKITPSSSSLGDEGSPEYLQLNTTAGVFELALVPLAPVDGVYEGGVVTSRFGGASVPLRFAVKTVPENPKTFAQITNMTVYLPSSQADIFSPESVDDDKTQWSAVQMTLDTAHCASGSRCFVAAYATNEYAMAGSQILDKDQMISRAIRIEIDDFDVEESRFTGYLKDDVSGFYRSVDSATGQRIWATSSMSGHFIVKRTGAFSAESEAVHDHEMATQKRERELDVEYLSCTDADIVKLMALAQSETGCSGISTLEGLQSADSATATACVQAAASSILADDALTSSIITRLVSKDEKDTGAVAGFANIHEFLANCLLPDSDSKKTVCKARTEVVCAADLVASRYLAAQTTAEKETLMGQFHGLLRESYLGSQYAAYQQDITTRQKWLEASDTPKFMAKDIENAVLGILKTWESDVLAAHGGVIRKQFSQMALEVLANPETSQKIKGEKYEILADYQQAWQSLSDATSLGLRRYNELLLNTDARKSKAAQMRPRLFDLYIAGLVESEINANTDNTSLNGGYGNSFYGNLSTMQRLDQSFDELVYMRDAEITVSNAVNSENGNVLSRRAKKASDAVKAVIERRDKVFGDYRNRTISQQSTAASLSNSIESLVTEIVGICGLPAGCNETDVKQIMVKPECDPLAVPFYCGFRLTQNAQPGNPDALVRNRTNPVSVTVDRKTGKIEYKDASGNVLTPDEDDPIRIGWDPVSDVNTGEAAEAILKYRKALQHIDVAKADYQALVNKVVIARNTCEQYAKSIQDWNKKRQELAKNVKKDIDEITAKQTDKYANVVKELDETYDKLDKAYTDANNDFADWKKTKNDEHAQGVQRINDIGELERTIQQLDGAGEVLQHDLSEFAEIGYVAGSWTVDPDGAVGFCASIAAHVLNIAQFSGVKGRSTVLSVDMLDKQKAKDLAELEIEYAEKLDEEQERIDRLRVEKEYQEKVGKLEKEIANDETQTEILKAHIELLREEFAKSDTYARDVQALENMRSEYLKLVQELLAKRAVILESQIEAKVALQHYFALVQRASMLRSQYDASTERLASINHLYTAPAVFFSYASDLEAVENKIELAKERIYDYLAALEYNAVRPFVDIRRAVYLARSPNDLDSILARLEDVDDNCGGKTNSVDEEHALIVSTREMLGITADFASMSATERFHYAISTGNVPVKALTRYTAEKEGKELLTSGHDLRSATFAFTIRDFANLQATCNAKISKFSFMLVGDNLLKDGAGTQVHPTITMFYNGKSTLVSCQTDIEETAESLGYRTAYDKYTTFNIDQSKISPNLGINAWGNPDGSLESYPLASSYTILIDPTIGENPKIEWDNVEDIQIKVMYTYENVRSGNKCKY